MSKILVPAKPVELNRILLEALQEIIGREGMLSIRKIALLPFTLENNIQLEQVFCLEDWQRLQTALESLYGQQGTRGIAIRTGQAFFKDSYRSFGSSTDLQDNQYRMLPKPRRIYKGLGILAELHNHYLTDLSIEILQDSECWYWRFNDRSWSRQYPEITDLLAKMILGMIQEFLSWTSGGKFYPVHQLDSDESTSGLVIQIRKHYVD